MTIGAVLQYRLLGHSLAAWLSALALYRARRAGEALACRAYAMTLRDELGLDAWARDARPRGGGPARRRRQRPGK